MRCLTKLLFFLFFAMCSQIVFSMDNDIIFQKKDGSICMLNINTNIVKQISYSKKEFIGIEIQNDSLYFRFKDNTTIFVDDNLLKQLIKLREKLSMTQPYTVKTDGNSISVYLGNVLKWEKIHSYKGFFAENEGYNNSSMSNTQMKIICERNWLKLSILSSSVNHTVVEIDIDTQKENVICKKCLSPTFSFNGDYVLCKQQDAQKYYVINMINKNKIELECINAFWIIS